MNHPEDSFYKENRHFIPNIITSLRSDDVMVTSSETTLSRTASGIPVIGLSYNNILSNNYRKLKRMSYFLPSSINKVRRN